MKVTPLVDFSQALENLKATGQQARTTFSGTVVDKPVAEDLGKGLHSHFSVQVDGFDDVKIPISIHLPLMEDFGTPNAHQTADLTDLHQGDHLQVTGILCNGLKGGYSSEAPMAHWTHHPKGDIVDETSGHRFS